MVLRKIRENFGDEIDVVKSVRQNEPIIFVKKFSEEEAVEIISKSEECGNTILFSGHSQIDRYMPKHQKRKP